MVGIEEYLPYIMGAVAGIVIVSAGAFYLFRRRGKPVQEEESLPKVTEAIPERVRRSITGEEVEKAKRDLKTLDVEREILSYAIRRLYEAHSEGKITEAERDQLASSYKERMKRVRDAIVRDESLMALHELESMKFELYKLFSERFDDLDSKISGLQLKLSIVPEEKKPKVPVKKTPETEGKEEDEATTARKKKAETGKSEAEIRIERIREEIERVLQRLGQIESEA